MNDALIRYTTSLLRYRWLVIPAVIVMVLLIAVGGRNLVFNNDYRIFFNPDNPQLVAFETLQKTYTKNDNVLLVLAPQDGNVFTRETLSAIEDITERAWQTPYSIRVDSLSNFQYSRSEADDLAVSDLYEDAKTLSDEELKSIRQVALNEPLLKYRLVSDRAHVAGVNITIEFPPVEEDGSRADQTAQGMKVVASVRELKQYINETYPHMAVYLTGIVMLNNAFGEATVYDMSHLLPVTILFILATVYLLLRNISGTLITFVVIILSVMTAMGLAGWLGIPLSSPVMSSPIIIMTLSVADCVHILSNWLHEVRKGNDKRQAMIESMRINFTPVFLTSATTAIGFLSLNFSDAPPFRDLGNVSAIGVMAAFVFSVVLLPVLAVMLPGRIRVQSETRTTSMMLRLSNWVISQQKRLLIGMGLLAIMLIALIPRNTLNDVFVHYFDERITFRTDTDFAVKNLTGVYFVDYSLNTGNSGDISEPENLRQIELFTNWLREQPEVIHVNTITDTFKRLNRNMHADQDDWYRLPGSRELAAQYLLLYEMSLPFGLDLNNQIDIDKQSTRISVTLKTISTQEILSFEQRVSDWMDANIPALKTVGASPSIMFSHIGMKNIISMLTGTTVALVLISLILILALRSWRYGLLSLIPNLVPAGMAFGLWAMINGEIGLALSVVTAMSLGIVVDDTIHFLSKYLRARREMDLGAEDAVRYAFSTVGVALWVTSVALVAGFLVLSTSSFTLNAGMGLLTAIVIAIALIVDFLLLPPLLIRLDRWLSRRQIGTPVSRPRKT